MYRDREMSHTFERCSISSTLCSLHSKCSLRCCHIPQHEISICTHCDSTLQERCYIRPVNFSFHHGTKTMFVQEFSMRSPSQSYNIILCLLTFFGYRLNILAALLLVRATNLIASIRPPRTAWKGLVTAFYLASTVPFPTTQPFSLQRQQFLVASW